MEWPICRLCQVETTSLDEHGLCIRTSITHRAVRDPSEYPRAAYPDLWVLIDSGKPVFPVSPADARALARRQRKDAA